MKRDKPEARWSFFSWRKPGRSTNRRRYDARRHAVRCRWLSAELLEERTVLDAVSQLEFDIPNNSADTLLFTGQFELKDGFDFYESTGTTYVGFAPQTGEIFKSLLSFSDGAVHLPGPNTQDQTAFSIFGTIGLATISTEPAIFVSPAQFNENNTIQISFENLTKKKAGEDISKDPLKEGAQTITVADLPFTISKFALDNPDAGTATSESRVTLQGDLSFDELKLNGLKLGVFNDNYVFVDQDIRLTGVDAQYTKSFNIAGGKFDGTFGVSYSSGENNDEHLFTFTGGVKYSSFDNGVSEVEVQFGDQLNAGLVVGNGKINTFSVTVSAKAENAFNTFSLNVTAKDVTFAYDIANDKFQMYGTLGVMIFGDNVTAVMGTSSSPGLVVSDANGVEKVNMGLNGNFTLAGLGIQIPTNDPLTIRYDKSASEYDVSGEIIAPDFFKATTTLGTASQPGLVVKDGHFQLDAFSLSLSDVDLGAFTIKKFVISYVVSAGETTYGATLAVGFPEGWEVDGSIVIVDDKIHQIFLEYQAHNVESRIAIGTTGLFLTEMDATILNLDKPDEIVVSGHMAADYGDPVTIFEEEVSMFRAEGSFSVDGKKLSMETDVWLGASTENGKTTGLLGKGSGELLLDWHDGIYSVSVHASLVDGTYTFDATFEINSKSQLWISAHASVNVPHSIPLIGGDHLGSMDFRLAYDPKDAANSYVAAWTRVNLIFTKPTVGVEYLFKKKKAKVIGSHEVNKIKKDPFNDPTKQNVVVYSSDFDVPLGTTSASFSADFPSNSGSQTISVVFPDGTETQVNSSTPNSTGITLLDDLNSATSLNFSLVDPSNTANPPNVPLSDGTYTIKLSSTDYKFPDTSANIQAITNDGNGNTMLILDPNSQNDTKGLQIGNTISVAGNVASTGAATPYNTEHVVTWVSSDGLTIVTDQAYDNAIGDGLAGTASGWQQPVFSATFLSPPPTVTLQELSTQNSGTEIDDVLVLSNPVLNVELSGTVDPAFANSNTTTVDLYVDTDGSGFDGVLLQSKVPTSFQAGTFTANAQGAVSSLRTGTYFVYAVVNDGTNTPVYSNYSSPFAPQRDVKGTITNQLQLPLAGLTIFADLNKNEAQDANEPVSQPSDSSGEYQIASRATPYSRVTVSTDQDRIRTYIYFPNADHRVQVGDDILITESTVGAYNKSFRVTDVFAGQTYVKTDQSYLGVDAHDAQANLLNLPGALPSIRKVTFDAPTGQTLVEFAAPHRLTIANGVGDRFVVNGSQDTNYSQTIHQVMSIVDATQVYTDQSSNSVGQNLTGSSLAKSIPIDTSIVVGISKLPAGFVANGDGTWIPVTYDGTTAAEADFTVMENAAIRGNVFADLTHDGIRAATEPISQFDFGTPSSPVEPGYTQVTAGTVYDSKLGYGWVNVDTNPVHDNDRGTGVDPVNLTQDGNANPDIIFRTDVPNGIYDVTLFFGDDGSTHDQVGVYLQGAQVDMVTTMQGHFSTAQYTDIVVSDGTLVLRMTDFGGSDPNARINGMSITRVDDPSLAGWTVELSQDEQVVGKTLTATDGSYRFGDLVSGDYTVDVIPANGSAATYSFDNSTESPGTVADVSGSGQRDQQQGILRNGASVGAASSFGIADHPNTGAANEVLRVNGTSQFLEVPANTNLAPGTGSFSFAGWIRVDDPTKAQDVAGVNDQASPNDGWALRISYNAQSSSKLSLVLREKGSTSSLQIVAGPTLQAHTWYHVAFTYDATVVDQNARVTFDAVQIYVNGELQTNRIGLVNDLPANPDISTTEPIDLNIGARGSNNGATSFLFGGYLDDVSLWNKALSPNQVLALYYGHTSPGYLAPPTAPVTIADDLDVKVGIDIGVDEFLAIGGTIQGNSLNSRDLQNPTAQPLSGWTVMLLNLDGSPVLDPSGSPMSATSQSDGRYLFPQVPTGSYLLEEVVPAGWRQTDPFDAPIQYSSAQVLTDSPGLVSVSTADFDQDGHVDIALGNADTSTNNISVVWGLGDGKFSSSSQTYTANVNGGVSRIATVDFNGDGVPDLGVIGASGKVVALVNNAKQGAGRSNLFSVNDPGWQLPAHSFPIETAVGDFDRDAKQDLVLTRQKLGTSSPSLRQYDFGTTSSNLESGYVRVAGSTAYSKSTGFGWDDTNAAKGHDGGGGVDPKDLTRDGVHGLDLRFLVDIPNGIYNVTLRYGAKDAARETKVYLQGTQVDFVTSAKNTFQTETYSGIEVSNGQLIVRLIDGANHDAQINGLVISDTPGITFLPGSFGPAKSQGLRLSSVGGIAVGYINDDAILDLALNVGNKALAVTAALGDGSGLFPTMPSIPSDGDLPLLEEGGPVSLADVNRDGLLDVVFPEAQSYVAGLYLDAAGVIQSGQTGFGVFSGAAVSAREQIVSDLNGDLKPDIVLLPESSTNNVQQIRVFANRADGVSLFESPQAFGQTTGSFTDIIASDVNGDGFGELIVLEKLPSLDIRLLMFVNQTNRVTPGIEVDLLSGTPSDDNDFVNGQVSQFYGTVFNDTNGNGRLDPTENVEAGATVYIDRNQDGVFDSAAEVSTTTDARGSYAFDELVDGNYHIRLAGDQDRFITTPGLGSHPVIVSRRAPMTFGSLDFGTATNLLQPVDDRIVSRGQALSFTVPVDVASAGRDLVFSLDPGAPPVVRLDPESGLLRWHGASVSGIYPLTIRATDAHTPTLSQTATFHISVTSTEGSLSINGTAGDDVLTIDNDRIEINGRQVNTSGVRAFEVFPDVGNDQLTLLVDGSVGPRSIVVFDSGGDDTYALHASNSQITIEDSSGIDTLDFSPMDTAVNVYLDHGGGEPLSLGQSRVHLDLIGTIENVVGTDFSDFISGNSANNYIDGGSGNDVILGADGNDVIDGQSGDDQLLGDHGEDILLGGAGNDFLQGGERGDVLSGGAGHDILDGQNGRDVLIGGTGRDRILKSNQGDLLIGGTTSDQSTELGLRAILSEWTSDRPYEQRTANLRGDANSVSFSNRLNQNHFLVANLSVWDDRETDYLDGQMGRDWYFAYLGPGATDIVLGRDENEDVDILWQNGPPPGNRQVGDSNGDGVFNSADLVLVLALGKYNDGIDNNATFTEGDWNQDGDFDEGDLVAAFAAGHYSTNADPDASRLAAAIDAALSEIDLRREFVP